MPMCTTTSTASFSTPCCFHGTLLGLVVDTCLRENRGGGVKTAGEGAEGATKPAGDTYFIGFPAGGTHAEPGATGGGGVHAEPGSGEEDINTENTETTTTTNNDKNNDYNNDDGDT